LTDSSFNLCATDRVLTATLFYQLPELRVAAKANLLFIHSVDRYDQRDRLSIPRENYALALCLGHAVIERCGFERDGFHRISSIHAHYTEIPDSA
jgi:hypothetical protein